MTSTSSWHAISSRIFSLIRGCGSVSEIDLSLRIGEIHLENGSQAASAAMQKNSLVCLAQLEGSADLGRRPTLNTAELDHDALGPRQALKSATQHCHCLAADHWVLGHLRPAMTWAGPVTGKVRVVQGKESSDLHSWLRAGAAELQV